MSPGDFSTFLRKQGHRVIDTDTCSWYDYRPMVFMSIPYLRELSPSRDQLARVLLGGPSIALRFPACRGKSNRQAGIFICNNKDYDLNSLHKKSRNQTRRGLENCTVEQLSFEDLENHGCRLQLDTYRRQGKDPQSFSSQKWHRICSAASGTKDFEAWGAWVKGSLAAFAVTALIEDCLYIYTQASSTEYLGFYPNNALTFLLTKQKISSPDVSNVCYGVKTLTRPSLDDYKVKMGYEIRPINECVVFNPLLRPFLWIGGNRIVHWIGNRRPDGSWRRLSLMLKQGYD